jgi:hypothetical protein
MIVTFLKSQLLVRALPGEALSGMGEIEFSRNLIVSYVMLIGGLSTMRVLLRSSQGFNLTIIPFLYL